jgi:hypothetical protein
VLDASHVVVGHLEGDQRGGDGGGHRVLLEFLGWW